MSSRIKSGHLTRRQFVAAGALGATAIAAGCKREKGNWEFLSDEEARTLAAICDQIVPADEFPSASQAGVLTYIDRQLVRHYRRHQDAYRNGLAQAEAMSRNANSAVNWPRFLRTSSMRIVGDLSQQRPAVLRAGAQPHP